MKAPPKKKTTGKGKTASKNAPKRKPVEREEISKVEEIFSEDNARIRFGVECVPAIKVRMQSDPNSFAHLFHSYILEQGQIGCHNLHPPRKILYLEDKQEGPESLGTRVDISNKTSRVFPSEYVIAITVDIPLSEIAIRTKIDILHKELVDTASSKLNRNIATNWLKLLYASALVNKNIKTLRSFWRNIPVIRWKVLFSLITKARSKIHQRGYQTLVFLVHPATLAELELFLGGHLRVTSTSFPYVKQSIYVPEGFVLIFPNDRTMAAKNIRIDLTAFGANKFVMGSATFGFMFVQSESSVILDPESVVCIRMSNFKIPGYLKEIKSYLMPTVFSKLKEKSIKLWGKVKKLKNKIMNRIKKFRKKNAGIA